MLLLLLLRFRCILHILRVPPLSRAVWALANGRNINESLPSVKELNEGKKKKKCFFHPSQAYSNTIYNVQHCNRDPNFIYSRQKLRLAMAHHWPHNNREDKKKKRERNRRRMDPEYYVRSISLDIFFFSSHQHPIALSPHLSTNLSVN